MIASKQFTREVEPNEFVPDDYFRQISPEEIFGNGAPVEVDLGCGDGKFVVEMAAKFPERNFLAVERLLGRVRKVCRKADQMGLTNLKVLRLESLYTLEWLLAPASIDRIHLLCPDPWPKARHHKHRLFQAPFLKAVCRCLKPQGELLFKTDHEEYFEWCEEQLAQFSGLVRVGWEEEDFFYPKTDFQLQWESQGKSLQRLRAQLDPGE